MEKLQFILAHYVQLLIFATACFGLGGWALRFSGAQAGHDRILHACLAICLGMGFHIVLLQALGILGMLTVTSVGTLLLAGVFAFVAHLAFPDRARISDGSPVSSREWKSNWFYWIFAALLVAELFLRPLAPPVAWDELMYHLPHARDWAMTGRLQVNESLRFPLFPYNFNLLYAASLIVSDDVLPHMLHALAGALVAVGLYRIASVRFGRPVGCLAVLFFLAATKVEFGNAYVDLGLTAFLFFSLVCMLAWFENRRFVDLCLAAFLLGVAAGIKYQALIFVPLLFGAVLWRERRLMKLAILAVVFAIPCIYWYIRAYLVSGDPFHPVGASLFGYWLWAPVDTEAVKADLRRVSGWPNWYVMLALAAFALTARVKGQAGQPALPFRAALVFAAYAFITWLLTSHYPRYLLPAFPVLCLLSALVLVDVAKKAATIKPVARLMTGNRPGAVLVTSARVLLLAVLAVAALSTSIRQWREIQANEQDRAAYLRQRIQSYEIAEFLRHQPNYRLVQIGLESDLYYLPTGTIGDALGPARYVDMLDLPPARLADKVRAFGGNALLLSASEAKRISDHGDFPMHFEQVKKTPGAALYRLRN